MKNKEKKSEEKKLSDKKCFHQWFLIALLAIFSGFVLLMAYCILRDYICYDNISHTDIALSVCSVLATIIIGINIFSYIDYKSTDKEVKILTEKYNQMNFTSLEGFNEILSEQCRYNADHSRMNAFFLKELNKPIWAIGWICRAIKSYYKCCSGMGLNIYSYAPISKSCYLILMDSIVKFVQKIEKEVSPIDKNSFFEKYIPENDEENINIFRRTLKDFVDYLIIIDLKGYNENQPTNKILIKELIKQITPDKAGKDVLESFLTFFVNLLKGQDTDSYESIINQCKEESHFKEVFQDKIDRLKEDDNDLNQLFDQLKAKIELWKTKQG